MVASQRARARGRLNSRAAMGPATRVQVASTQAKFDVPMMATKICAWRTLPVRRSTITGTVSPA
jgi:hypothetical protein